MLETSLHYIKRKGQIPHCSNVYNWWQSYLDCTQKSTILRTIDIDRNLSYLLCYIIYWRQWWCLRKTLLKIIRICGSITNCFTVWKTSTSITGSRTVIGRVWKGLWLKGIQHCLHQFSLTHEDKFDSKCVDLKKQKCA